MSGRIGTIPAGMPGNVPGSAAGKNPELGILAESMSASVRPV